MSKPDALIIEADGGSRGNPGPSGSGAIVVDAATGLVIREISEFIGIATNNVAEYRALKAALEEVHRINPLAKVRVRMDSKLVIEQMSGNWKIKHPDMRALAIEVQQLTVGLNISYEWIPREENSRADALANKAMDEVGSSIVDTTVTPIPAMVAEFNGELPSSVRAPGHVTEPLTTLVLVRHGRTHLTETKRSMVRNMQIALEMGYLTAPLDVFVDLAKAVSYPEDKLVYMCTGSQGEPMAVLARMVNLDHQITIGEGDTVILASSLIPGNENAVYRVIDGLTKLGANVVHKGNAKVHVSGHAAAGELLYCYNILKPKNVMPVHGEYRHLIANGKLAEQTGVPHERVLITEDGWVIDLVDGIAEVVGGVECGLLFVDGKTVGKVTEEDLKDRRVLAEEGFISIFCVIDAKDGRVKIGPEIRARAFAEEDNVFNDVKPLIERALAEAAGEGVRDPYALQQVIRRTIGTWVNKAHRRRPMIIPVVIAE